MMGEVKFRMKYLNIRGVSAFTRKSGKEKGQASYCVVTEKNPSKRGQVMYQSYKFFEGD